MPPFDDNELEELASSADPSLDAQTETVVTDKSADATSSPAAPGETDADLLSVVRDVVTESRSDQTAPPAEGEEAAGQPADENGEKKDAEDDYSDVPFNKHPRFQALVREKNALKQDAQRYNNVQTFMDQNNVTAEEAADLLVIGGLIKTNPQAAWARIKPTIQKLLIAAGEVLPDDLTERVSKGEMSKEAAMEVSRARAGVQSVQATRTFEQQRAQQRAETEAVQALGSAANEWEADRRLKDPNFEAKLPSLMEKVAYLQRIEGVPKDPAGVKAQLQKAYKAIPAPAAAIAAVPAAPVPKKAITPIRGGQVAGDQRPEPKSVLDIVRANRRAG